MRTATALIHEVAAAGGGLVVAEGKLKVSAPDPLPENTIKELRARKAEIVTILSDKGEADWMEWFNERAAILEFDAGLSRDDAEAQAFQHAIAEWVNAHPPKCDPNVCAGCGKTIDTGGHDWRPLGDGATVHYSGNYGLRCVENHSAKRRQAAITALKTMGIGK